MVRRAPAWDHHRMTSMLASLRSERRLVGAVITAIALLAGVGWWLGAPLTLPYAVFVLAAMLVVASVHARTPLSRPVLWCLAAWGIAHMAGGVVLFDSGAVLYNVDLGLGPVRFDRLVHALGFGAATFAAHEVMVARVGPARALIPASILMGLGFGAINETVEFVMSQLIETNVGGFTNTGWDLVANVVGCVTAGVLLERRTPVARNS